LICSCRPLFPEGIVVSDIPVVSENKVEEFKAENISNSYLSRDDPEAIERTRTNQIQRDIQYARWNWANNNINDYVNMLRLSGHPDENIQAMFHGRPMCFNDEHIFLELLSALKKLACDIESEMGWKNVGFIFAGSSVPGFSQNPLKGFRNVPSKITSITKSDVDICISADGVNSWQIKQKSEGKEEPKHLFPTTCSIQVSGSRCGLNDLNQLCSSVSAFHAEWKEKLAGGLQFTFCEDGLDIPPWEARANLGLV